MYQLEVDINCAVACADMAMTISSPEASEIVTRKFDHVLSAGAGALGIDEVKIITEHRDDFAARLHKLLTTEKKSLTPRRDLLQATYPTAKAPLVKGKLNNEGPPAALTTADAPNDYVPKWVALDLIPEFKARRLSGYNHFLAQAKGASGLTNLESQLETELQNFAAELRNVIRSA